MSDIATSSDITATIAKTATASPAAADAAAALAASTSSGDIVIIGAGLAGLFTALKLAPLPVTVIAAAPLGQGASSAWAQGGIAAAVGEGDSPQAHCADTIKAGAGIVDHHIAQLTANEASERIKDLLHYGVPFDQDLAGHYLLSREAAHSAKRIVRVAGDGAGRAIMQALITTVRNTPSIRVLEGYEAYDLTQSDTGRVNGICLTSFNATLPREAPLQSDAASSSNAPAPTIEQANPQVGSNNSSNTNHDKTQTYRRYVLPARAVVLATGGVGYLYDVTTNPPYARGDALAMAARAGAVIADAEFVQFHPTAIDAGLDPAPLATEALRGEGALLINSAGKRFMVEQHEDAELGPRDIVARGVFREIKAGRGAFLDCRDAIGADFPDRYPTVYKRCREAQIDPITQPIPIAPAEHYHMGGIATDEHGRASIEGLWACGEVTSTGLHGANRLASNSLLEAVVFGARVALDIAASIGPQLQNGAAVQRVNQQLGQQTGQQAGEQAGEQAGQQPTPLDETLRGTLIPLCQGTRLPPTRRAKAIADLRRAMQAHVGVERNGDGLRAAIKTIIEIDILAGDDIELVNMTLTARFIAVAALLRCESRGGHYRSDFTQTNPALAKRSAMTLGQLNAATG